MGRPQRLTVEQLPPSTEVSRDPIHPKSRSCWPGICSDKVPFAGSVWSGEVGYVGLQVAAALEMTGGQGNTHSTFRFAGGSAACGSGTSELRNKEIYSQSVKVVIPGKKEHGKGSGDYCFGACVTLYYNYDFFKSSLLVFWI